MKKRLKRILYGALALVFALLCNCGYSFAEEGEQYGIGMSPLNQKIILVPGQTYYGSFKINNPASHNLDFYYNVSVRPFYVDEEYSIYYQNNGDFNQIADWTTTNISSGIISPNDDQEIYFTINVPEDAPAGGQYMAIVVSSDLRDDENNGLNIKVSQAMAHIVYAEVAGTTVRQGEVLEASVPSFMLSGNISGTSSIKNTGNVHGTATYKLQVFPLFSNEEVYTNEEDPEEKTILPDRTLMSTTEWTNTPAIGIFNVVYTAEFEGVTTQVSKMVIKCPIWLLFIIIFAIVAIIIYFIMKSKARKNSRRRVGVE